MPGTFPPHEPSVGFQGDASYRTGANGEEWWKASGSFALRRPICCQTLRSQHLAPLVSINLMLKQYRSTGHEPNVRGWVIETGNC